MSEWFQPTCNRAGNVLWERVVSGLFDQNCYLVWQDGKNECLIIDPGFEPELVIEAISRLNLNPVAILNTHGHVDHIAGNTRLKEIWPDCPVIIGAKDSDKLTDPRKNLSHGFGVPLRSVPPDLVLSGEATLNYGGLWLLAREVPGHSEGHLVFVCEAAKPIIIFVGDVIFSGSIGRTDFPGGDYQKLILGINTVIFGYPEDTILLPGHGPPTTVGQERRWNPFVAG